MATIIFRAWSSEIIIHRGHSVHRRSAMDGRIGKRINDLTPLMSLYVAQKFGELRSTNHGDYSESLWPTIGLGVTVSDWVRLRLTKRCGLPLGSVTLLLFRQAIASNHTVPRRLMFRTSDEEISRHAPVKCHPDRGPWITFNVVLAVNVSK